MPQDPHPHLQRGQGQSWEAASMLGVRRAQTPCRNILITRSPESICSRGSVRGGGAGSRPPTGQTSSSLTSQRPSKAAPEGPRTPGLITDCHARPSTSSSPQTEEMRRRSIVHRLNEGRQVLGLHRHASCQGLPGLARMGAVGSPSDRRRSWALIHHLQPAAPASRNGATSTLMPKTVEAAGGRSSPSSGLHGARSARKRAGVTHRHPSRSTVFQPRGAESRQHITRCVVERIPPHRRKAGPRLRLGQQPRLKNPPGPHSLRAFLDCRLVPQEAISVAPQPAGPHRQPGGADRQRLAAPPPSPHSALWRSASGR